MLQTFILFVEATAVRVQVKASVDHMCIVMNTSANKENVMKNLSHVANVIVFL